MTIVAHQDDDFLFMNPDIDRGIAAGLPNVTVYLTAGDAGMDQTYWMGREAGAKAAYAVMAGSDTWVEEPVTLAVPGGTVTITSSYLADDPGVRLYFLRLPDGGGVLAPDQQQQLARLESGDLASVTAVDGSASYSRADLVAALTALMTRHSPTEFRLQVHQGDSAQAEHTDHRHTAEFSEEALTAYSGGIVTVTHYINYDSQTLPANLTEDQSTRALDVMRAYAAHDPGTLNEDGSLQQVYVDWTKRQYLAETYTLDTDAPPVAGGGHGDLAPGWTLPGAWSFALEGPDAALFDVGTAIGSIQVQDWFKPTRADAWDDDGDHLYEVTRIGTPAEDGPPVSQTLQFEAAARGGLLLADAGPLVQLSGEDSGASPSDPPPTPEGETFDFVPTETDQVIPTVPGPTSAMMQLLGEGDARWDAQQDAHYLLVLSLTPDRGGGFDGTDALF